MFSGWSGTRFVIFRNRNGLVSECTDQSSTVNVGAGVGTEWVRIGGISGRPRMEEGQAGKQNGGKGH